MAYKLRYTGRRQGNWIEHTYSEVVEVKNGIATCQKVETVARLRATGFELIKEPPVKVFNKDDVPKTKTRRGRRPKKEVEKK